MRESIDGASFAQAMIHAAASLNLQKQQINELNVFPVPDGTKVAGGDFTARSSS